MANAKEIKQRIVSVKKTRKMTQAMKMVAAAKFKRAVQKIKIQEPYSEVLESVFADILSRVEPSSVPFHLSNSQGSKELLIVVSSDRGMCGGFNTNLFKQVQRHIDSASHPIELSLIGNKAIQFFQDKPTQIRDQQTFFEEGTFDDGIKSLLAPYIDEFKSGQLGKVTVIYNKFINALTSEVTVLPLLPLINTNDHSFLNTTKSDFIYEPSLNALDDFLNHLIGYKTQDALLNSTASEEGSRMTAMESASENAKEMITDLTLLYNRSRQAAITTELTEIVGGAAALTQ